MGEFGRGYWGLSAVQMSALMCMYAASDGVASFEEVQAAVTRGSKSAPVLGRVIICRLRRRLADRGAQIQIDTYRGRGYGLTPESVEVIAAKINGAGFVQVRSSFPHQQQGV